MDEMTEKTPESILPSDDIEQTLLALHEAGEAEPPEYWWRSELDL